MIRADVAIAEQRQIIDVPVETKSEAIRVLWNTYGPAIDIKRWVEDEQEEVQDEQVDSNESDDSGELDGEGGSTQGDILQVNE
ncbi:hypothetical protein [uncultured Streptococcus sp.]|uniref:hypothetical protein n=1 Tax=uncultured Streptococcus sp. TaxID=83427 RepID=UPI002592B3E5|nr:hypothetical protein [uncultured Streptococcus sp.]